MIEQFPEWSRSEVGGINVWSSLGMQISLHYRRWGLVRDLLERNPRVRHTRGSTTQLWFELSYDNSLTMAYAFHEFH